MQTDHEYIKCPVSSACEKLGVRQRKNIKKIYGWTQRKATVVDLSTAEKKRLSVGGEKELDRYLRKKGCYAFPALDIREVRSIRRSTVLVKNGASQVIIVCPENIPELAKIANFIMTAVQRISCDKPMLLNDTADINTLTKGNIILLGGSHQNRLAYYLSTRNLAYADLAFPGRSGFLIHHLCGIMNPDFNIIQLAAGIKGSKGLLKALKTRLKMDQNEALVFKYGDVVELSSELQKTFANPYKTIDKIVQHAQRRYCRKTCRSFKEAGRRLANGYDAGGTKKNYYTGFNVPAVIKTFHAYKMTGDKKFLNVFKTALWGLVEYYLKTSGGSSYISDYDFYLGGLVSVWNLAEQEPVFSKSERLIITNLLLSSVRQIFRYKEARWPTAPGKIRFNHETFPALSVYQASLYFKKYYPVHDFKEWDQMAEQCFSGTPAVYTFHKENSSNYQWFVPAHKLFYDILSGTMETINNGVARKTAYNAIPTVDNFGHLVDYGDTDCPIGGSPFLAPYIEAVAGAVRDPVLAAVAVKMATSIPADSFTVLPQPAYGHTGSKSVAPGHLPETGKWERTELAEHARKKFRPLMPAKYVANKIGFRTDWNNNDQFLVFEPQTCGSHIHCDMNAILRYNHLGRIWLVDNGYGMPANEPDATQAWRRRETGPNDHNTVIFRDANGDPVFPPPFCAVLYCGKPLSQLFVLQSVLCGINGAEWSRSVIIGANTFLLVIDQIRPGGKEANIECQWNVLGQIKNEENLRILEQKGVRLFHQYS